MIRDAQKDQLSQIKKALEVRFCKRISWEELADMAGIEPRTLKTYRMPIRPDVFAVDGLAARRRRQQMACATSVSPAYFKLTRGPTMLTQTVLYWSLPSPLAFCQGVTDAAHGKRAIVVNRPANADLDYGLKEGLRNANIIEPLILIIEDGANISSTLAPHFNNEVMHANRLAAVRLPQTQAVVLRTTGERSQRHCEKYMSEFIEALSSTSGNVRLVLYMQDASITRNDSSGQIAVLVYDGALKTEEMQAYVSYRMLGREELGSTSLVRQLVTDFASFDVSLADNLIQMDKNEILNLPLSLTPLIAEDENRWNSVKWMGGSASLTSPAETHPLREWFVASHSSPLTAIGKDASDRRYWRACLKAISPWLEERRLIVLKELQPALDQLEPNFQFQKKVGEYIEIVDRDDLEYNDLCFQHRRIKDCRLPLTARQSQAFGLCHKAKKVRNELAHSRKPTLDILQELVVAMDDFCRPL